MASGSPGAGSVRKPLRARRLWLWKRPSRGTSGGAAWAVGARGAWTPPRATTRSRSAQIRRRKRAGGIASVRRGDRWVALNLVLKIEDRAMLYPLSSILNLASATLVEWDEGARGWAAVVGLRADESVVGELLADVGHPAGDPA